jgi:hypothetical protein
MRIVVTVWRLSESHTRTQWRRRGASGEREENHTKNEGINHTQSHTHTNIQRNGKAVIWESARATRRINKKWKCKIETKC